MEWQPIETAPRDGTVILAYVPNVSCYGYDHDEIMTLAAYGSGEDFNGYDGEGYRPTHWMPLPQPPKGDE